MIKFKNKNIFLIIIFVFIGFQFFPLIGLGYFGYESPNLNQIDDFDLRSSPSSQLRDNDLENFNSKSYINDGFSIFDDSLKEFLVNLSQQEQKTPKKVKIIIHFNDKISKEERVEIISSIFNEYEIISNYDIIPGAYIKLNPNQLIKKKDVIDGIISITQIHKSNVYELPSVSDDSVQLSALDSGDYSNWWLSAIGAESLPYDGSGVKVAVIDTGIYPHPDLTIINNSNFVADEELWEYDDKTGHGTHAAGIIGGDGGGSSGEYRGVASGVLLINARAGNESGLDEGDIIRAIEWSSKPTHSGGAGADIVSMSFGREYPYISDLITQAISNAKDNLVLFLFHLR